MHSTWLLCTQNAQMSLYSKKLQHPVNNYSSVPIIKPLRNENNLKNFLKRFLILNWQLYRCIWFISLEWNQSGKITDDDSKSNPTFESVNSSSVGNLSLNASFKYSCRIPCKHVYCLDRPCLFLPTKLHSDVLEH